LIKPFYLRSSANQLTNACTSIKSEGRKASSTFFSNKVDCRTVNWISNAWLNTEWEIKVCSKTFNGSTIAITKFESVVDATCANSWNKNETITIVVDACVVSVCRSCGTSIYIACSICKGIIAIYAGKANSCKSIKGSTTDAGFDASKVRVVLIIIARIVCTYIIHQGIAKIASGASSICNSNARECCCICRNFIFRSTSWKSCKPIYPIRREWTYIRIWLIIYNDLRSTDIRIEFK